MKTKAILFRSLLTLAAAVALAAAPARADSIVTTDAFLPIVHINGATGVYRTDVSVFNPGDATADVRFYFGAADTDGTNGQSFKLTNGLGSRQSVTLDDILANYFQVSSGYGLLEVQSYNSVPLIVTSNTYNAGGSVPGTFGQFSPGQAERNSVGFGSTNDYDLYVTGVPHDGNHRTNAVIMNPSKYNLSATMELVDNGGNVIGRVQHVNVPPYSLHQLNDVFNALFGSAHPASDLSWRLNLYVDTNTGATLLAYATVTDLRSGDPYLIPAAAQVIDVPFVRPAPDGAVRTPTPLATPSPIAPKKAVQIEPAAPRS